MQYFQQLKFWKNWIFCVCYNDNADTHLYVLKHEENKNEATKGLFFCKAKGERKIIP